MADVMVYVTALDRLATQLDEQARKVAEYHTAWKNTTAYSAMDSALPDPKSRDAYKKSMDAVDQRLTLLETAIRSWADGFRQTAVDYRDADVFGARAIGGSA